jgi:DNA-binding phage protein
MVEARRMVEARMSLRFVAGDLEISRDALRRALRESY